MNLCTDSLLIDLLNYISIVVTYSTGILTMLWVLIASFYSTDILDGYVWKDNSESDPIKYRFVETMLIVIPLGLFANIYYELLTDFNDFKDFKDQSINILLYYIIEVGLIIWLSRLIWKRYEEKIIITEMLSALFSILILIIIVFILFYIMKIREDSNFIALVIYILYIFIFAVIICYYHFVISGNEKFATLSLTDKYIKFKMFCKESKFDKNSRMIQVFVYALGFTAVFFVMGDIIKNHYLIFSINNIIYLIIIFVVVIFFILSIRYRDFIINGIVPIFLGGVMSTLIVACLRCVILRISL